MVAFKTFLLTVAECILSFSSADTVMVSDKGHVLNEAQVRSTHTSVGFQAQTDKLSDW